MSIIILDTETTGLPLNRNAQYTELHKYDDARIVQISFMICNTDLEPIEMKDFIIKTDGFQVKNTEFHGITDEISMKNGKPFIEVAKILSDDLLNASVILAHNADFDINVIKSELYRYGMHNIIQIIDQKLIVCTMKTTKRLVNIKNRYGFKFPSLAELYNYACHESLENAHNSMYDVINLHKAVKSLYDKHLWTFKAS